MERSKRPLGRILLLLLVLLPIVGAIAQTYPALYWKFDDECEEFKDYAPCYQTLSYQGDLNYFPPWGCTTAGTGTTCPLSCTTCDCRNDALNVQSTGPLVSGNYLRPTEYMRAELRNDGYVSTTWPHDFTQSFFTSGWGGDMTVEFFFRASDDFTFGYIFGLWSNYYHGTSGLITERQIFNVYIDWTVINVYYTYDDPSKTPDAFSLPLNGVGRRHPDYLRDGEWHHLAFRYGTPSAGCGTCPNDGVQIFIDGQAFEMNNPNTLASYGLMNPYLPSGAYLPTSGSGPSSVFMRLGTGPVAGEFGYDIDEIAVYNEAVPFDLIYGHYDDYLNTISYSSFANCSTLDGPYDPNASITGPINPDPVVSSGDEIFRETDFPVGYFSTFTDPGITDIIAPGSTSIPFLIDQYKTFPVPRYKARDESHLLIEVGGASFADNPPSSTSVAQNLHDLRVEMANDFNYAYALGMAGQFRECDYTVSGTYQNIAANYLAANPDVATSVGTDWWSSRGCDNGIDCPAETYAPYSCEISLNPSTGACVTGQVMPPPTSITTASTCSSYVRRNDLSMDHYYNDGTDYIDIANTGCGSSLVTSSTPTSDTRNFSLAAPLDYAEWDGWGYRNMIRRYSDYIQGLGGSGYEIDYVWENGEQLGNMAQPICNSNICPLIASDPAVQTSYNAYLTANSFTTASSCNCSTLPTWAGGSSVTYTSHWRDYVDHQQFLMREMYWDQMRNEFTGAEFNWYHLSGESSNWPWGYTAENRTLLQSLGGRKYPACQFYPQTSSAWYLTCCGRTGMYHVWPSRDYEISTFSDDYFAPFISAGSDDGNGGAVFSVEDYNMFRPGPYLGILKTLAIMGSDYYHVFCYNVNSATYQTHDARWHGWQMLAPAYAQGIMNRAWELYQESEVLHGDPGFFSGQFRYWTGNFGEVVSAREGVGGQAGQYLISGTTQNAEVYTVLSSNDESFIRDGRDVDVEIDGHDLKFGIRRQGSTYVYIPSATSWSGDDIFYQLDGWHEEGHYSWWSTDFALEAELFDEEAASSSCGMHFQIYTEENGPTPHTAITDGDFTNSTSFVTMLDPSYGGFMCWPDPVADAPSLTYKFQPRATTDHDDLYLLVRARTANDPTGLIVELDGGTVTNTVACIDQTDWQWYAFDINSDPIRYSSLTREEHFFKLFPFNSDLEIDQVMLATSATYTAMSGGFASTTSCGSTPSVTANATPTSVCTGTTVSFSVTLDACGSAGYTYDWDFDDGGSSSSATPTHAFSTAGTFDVEVTVCNSGSCCNSDVVSITVTATPTTANAGIDQSICGTTATLAGNTPTIGTGNWTLISGSGTITTPSSPTSGITSLGVGANVFRWTISNPPCSASYDEVTITGYAAPTTANAGSDQNICNSTATLAGNTPTVGSGTWTLISGSGTITTPSSPTSGITGLGSGANVFRWTITNGPCTASFDDVTITGYSTLIANAGSNTGYVYRSTSCGSPYSTYVTYIPQLGASASGGTSPYTYLWNNASYLTKTGVMYPEEIADPFAVPTSNTNFTVTVTDANGCTATDAVYVISVDLCNTAIYGTGGCASTRVEVCHFATCTSTCTRPDLAFGNSNALTTHVAHGDLLGSCPGSCRRAGLADVDGEGFAEYLHAIPNPFSTTVVLTFGLGIEGEAVLEIYDSKGIKIAEVFRSWVHAEAEYTTELNGNNISQGLYYCRLKSPSGKQLTKTLVLQR